MQPQSDLVALYREGAEADVRELEILVSRLADCPEDWPDCHPRLRELVHNVKGQGSAFGYQLMTRIGESLSALLRGGASADAERLEAHRLRLISAHVTALGTVLERDIAGSGGPLGEALVHRLSGLTGQL